MTTMQRLNAYFARKSLQKLDLGSAYREKVDRILGLLEKAKSADPQVKVSDVFEALYPELSPASANRGLNRLVQEINDSAKAQGVGIALMVSSSKGAGKRSVWFKGSMPEPNPANFADLEGVPPARLVEQQGVFMDRVIALVTFNEHETAAVLERFCPGGKPKPYPADLACNLLARWNELTIIHCVSEQGENRAQQTCQALIKAFPTKLDTIIAVGIAFGVDREKQSIGDVLVAKSVYDYERARQTRGITEPRGESYPCSSQLRQRFWHADQYQRSFSTWPRLHFGALLSGNKLIDDKEFRDALRERADGIIGGEMEGVGVYHAVDGKNVQWLIVKAICDWADGDKNNPQKEKHQKLAAKNAARVVHDVLREWGGQPQDGKFACLPDLDTMQEGNRPILDSRGVWTGMKKDVEKPVRPTGAESVEVLEALKKWAVQPDSPPFFALLGEYGMGKTIACQRLTR
ncbi:MAG: hypothetical protein LBP86_07055, partial [Azoarcus sp.]|nr:hypothetical protein [Azoarcus sp.]